MNKRCLGCMEEYSNEFDVCPHCGYVEGTEVEEAVHMEPGTSLADRYIIGKVLGYGGFGVTYIGWDERLEQKVAIKEYLPSEFSTRMPGEASVTVFSGDRSEQFAEGLDKFVEEAKRLSKFQNEAGIVKVFDSFKANNTAYIIMEYLDGETLTSYMEREGVIPEEKAVEMLAPVMISLQAVHEEGILHRDIAPDNIFLTKNGEVKLIDFGASRYATTSHSRSLTVIIKPGYSPEEQYRSRGDQGPHTDVYALAAVMYKMITGVTPPDALERRALIETKKKELLKDIHKTNKSISPTIENAILNAMNVQIEDRTPDVLSFMSELNSSTPVKRRYGKIKKIDVYAWPLWVKVVIPAVVVACLTTGILLMTGVIDFPSLFSGSVKVPEGMIVVPDVEGMDKDAALEEITKLGLTPSPEGNVDSAYVEVGKIVLQTPQGGSYLEKNGKVVLTVSSGSGVVGPVNGISTVPYVVWDTEEAGCDKLHQAGLEIFQDWAYDDNVERGKIISQSIKANEKVKQGTQIKIIVSLGKEGENLPNVSTQNGVMPNLKGLTEEQVQQILDYGNNGEPYSFGMVSYQEGHNATVPKGQVYKQSIAAGTNLTRNTNGHFGGEDGLTIWFSAGPDPSKFTSNISVTRTEKNNNSQIDYGICNNGLEVPLKEVFYDENGRILFSWHYDYNDNGQKIKERSSDENGRMNSEFSVYEYHANGKVSKHKLYSDLYWLDTTESYWYVVVMTEYDTTGALVKETRYDSGGNVTEVKTQ